MPRDWYMEVEEAISGRGDWFSSHLIRLIFKADGFNRELLRSPFPDHVAAYDRYMAQTDEWERADEPV